MIQEVFVQTKSDSSVYKSSCLAMFTQFMMEYNFFTTHKVEDIDIIRKGKDGKEFGDGPIDCTQLRPHVTNYVFL